MGKKENITAGIGEAAKQTCLMTTTVDNGLMLECKRYTK